MQAMENNKFPNRHPNHTLEQKSEAYFYKCIPKEWSVNRPDRDYGHDLYIEISEGEFFRGLELIVQLKSSHEPNPHENHERQVFNVSTYNYLRDNLRVVLLIKYVENEDEAYWILLKDVEEPNQDNETFTVRFPRNNSLSTIDWSAIVTHVKMVTAKKLAANRPQK
jgi:Domain of unknown function (DUF4365)